MKPETKITLVKDLEKMKSIRARDNYTGAWFGLICAIVFLALQSYYFFGSNFSKEHKWFIILSFIVWIAVLLQSFFIIIRYITNRRFILILEALLESKTTEEINQDINSINS